MFEDRNTVLKTQRKNITQSILTLSKSSSKDLTQQRSAELIKTATQLGRK